jgi:hypothetical protein
MVWLEQENTGSEQSRTDQHDDGPLTGDTEVFF